MVESIYINPPITGFRELMLTSATGLYVQFIPASFSSWPQAAAIPRVNSRSPIAACAIAPGLNEKSMYICYYQFDSAYN